MSKTLLTQITVSDPGGPFNGKKVNILFDQNQIVSIGNDTPSADQVIDASDWHIGPGWTDTLAYCGEPGEEWKEDLQTLSSAAAAGGFTRVAALCGNHPAPDNAAAISYVRHRAAGLAADILPLGHFTLGAEGKELAELYDMQKAGAAAFFDGDHSLLQAGMKSRIFEYAANCNAVIYSFPWDRTLSAGGSMHEGKVSTSLGLKGIPAISEVNALMADIELARWLKVPLRVVRVSAAESVELIRQAKKQGMEIYAAVPVLNLLYTDDALQLFDENFKILPPLRTESDRVALLQGLLDGTLDAVCSNHAPQDSESKEVEFEYAAFGSATIQSVFGMLMAALADKATAEIITRLLSAGPARFLGLQKDEVNTGSTGNYTLFSLSGNHAISRQTSGSKAWNVPVSEAGYPGEVMGTITANGLNLVQKTGINLTA